MTINCDCTIKEVYWELRERLEKDSLIPEQYFTILSLEGKDNFCEENEKFPKGQIICYSATGTNEGHLACVGVFDKENKFKHLFTGKTFQGKEFAAKVAMACAIHLPV
ncbi:hypothetical protein LR013_00870 [candidate division NPL-UPA2 bacterium]|nr:hypothetical protein [candidate division NPL-UPA2 bacterium]